MKKIMDFCKKNIVDFVKAAIVGATLRVPGMSGGTTAIILKIYDKLLNAVNTFFKNVKENFVFLAVFASGAGIAFLAFNSLVSKVTTAFPAISAYFFVGIILFGFPALIKESGITYSGERFLSDEKSSRTKKIVIAIIKDMIPFIAGVAIVIIISVLQGQGLLNGEDYEGFGKYIFNILAGFFAGIALVLPGLSFTYFLTVIGLMDTFSGAISISSIDFGFLATFAIGGLIGLVVSAKVLDEFIKGHKRGTYFCIAGFLIGSVVMLLIDPKYIPSTNEILYCAIFFVLGAALILSVTHFADRLSNKATQIQPAQTDDNNLTSE